MGRRPPELDALREDVRHEQFFFDASTRARLLRWMEAAQDPLLVCMPSLAVERAAAGRPARLLDRDRRFHRLPRASDFDLHAPDYVEGAHDLVLCDPPFANVPLDRLRSTLDLLQASATVPQAHPALAICYISSREAALQAAFAPFDLVPIGPPLGYRSVAAQTQDRIRLYASRGARELCGTR